MAIQGTGWTGISNYIKNTLIPSLTTIRAANIFDFETTDLGGFPSVTITASDISGSFADNARNKRTYRFVIRIFIDRSNLNFGAQKAETILKSVADELISKFDADPTLGGNCIYTLPFSAKYGYVDRGNNNIRLTEITLDCVDVNTWR